MEPLTNPVLPTLREQGHLVLDGGLATALEAEGRVLDSQLWSAELIADDPDSIRAVHSAYLRAGADCITTASYQASFEGFAEAGMESADVEALLMRSTQLALEARDAVVGARPAGHGLSRATGDGRPLVAASVGPYGAYLADGSEYDGRYSIDASALDRFHRRRFSVLARSGADLLACETIPSRAEAEVLLEILQDHPTTWAWLSFSCRDGRSLWDGTPVESLAAACSDYDRVAAVGVNCTAPGHLPELIARMAATTRLPLIAYPNSGEVYSATSGSWSGAAGGWLEGVRGAYRAGARILGGCCRIGPGGISELRRALHDGDWTAEGTS